MRTIFGKNICFIQLDWLPKVFNISQKKQRFHFYPTSVLMRPGHGDMTKEPILILTGCCVLVVLIVFFYELYKHPEELNIMFICTV